MDTDATEIWRLKNINPNYNYDLELSIATLARSYTAEQRKCQLCLAEKTKIMFQKVENRIRGSQALNRRTEIHRHCPHYEKFRLDRW